MLGPLDPLHLFWPHVRTYYEQREMVLSVRDSAETYVVAGNMLGKDFISGYIALTFFMWPQLYYPQSYVLEVEKRRLSNYDPHTRRVLTTSVKSEHLDVLWAEIARWVQTCKEPLPIIMLHHEIRFLHEASAKNPMSYLKGQVSAKGEGLAGHHAAYTLGIGDEASGLDDEVYKQFQGWAKRMLYFGNPNPTNNFFKQQYMLGTLAV